ncbi:hypothetical protein M090_2039 [Parabacteroides distasonis str. 3776 Po2 i]|nr:hypothetical protein M090_2039 [Parabacteroides distasonis str. 3776 Po2 i]
MVLPLIINVCKRVEALFTGRFIVFRGNTFLYLPLQSQKLQYGKYTHQDYE